MTQETDLFRLIYASRNLLPAATAEDEIAGILAASRRRNAGLGITGALLFSADSFVQALEGTLPAVEQLFEHIQCDPRHGDVVVLDAGPVAERSFGAWSMAYAGRREEVRFTDLRSMPGPAGSSALLTLLSSTLERMETSPA